MLAQFNGPKETPDPIPKIDIENPSGATSIMGSITKGFDNQVEAWPEKWRHFPLREINWPILVVPLTILGFLWLRQ